MNLIQLAEILGHSSLRIIRHVYSRLSTGWDYEPLSQAGLSQMVANGWLRMEP
jgi:hypothetical protein